MAESEKTPAPYSFLFTPVYKDYLWGGERIIQKYNRDQPDGIYAESWEVSDRDEGLSVVENGPLAGMGLAELVREYGADLLGKTVRDDGRFPLLIKLIDSKQDLSIQVHPNDANAHVTGGEPKTEMWYILDADPGACVYSGFTEITTPEEFRDRAAAGSLGSCMEQIEVAKGDCIFTPGGRVHAIGAGCLILEVQQNSNTTYRIDDWGRVGADGKPRELHLEQAENVIVWDDETPAMTQPTLEPESDTVEIWNLLTTPYFAMRRIHIDDEWTLNHDGTSFHVLFAKDEDLILVTENGEKVNVPHGRSVLIPALLKSIKIQCRSGRANVIDMFIPSA